MKKILGIVLLLGTALGMQAQLLWKVSGNELTQSSYVMGTHHPPLSIKDSIVGMKQALADTKLPAIMNAAPTFVAVGAGHLPGEYGLLNLLKKKGYTVEPVN